MTTIQILGIKEHDAMINLKSNTKEALKNLGFKANIEEITEIEALLNYHLSGIPAMAINGVIIFERKVPSVDDLEVLFQTI